MSGREFWVVFDYGTAGVWGVARARSESEIVRNLPELKVVEHPPSWMTPETERDVRSVSSFTVADPDTYPQWLRAVLAKRGGS